MHLCDVDIGWFDASVPPRSRRYGRNAGPRRAAGRDSPTARSTLLCSDHTPVDDDAKLLPFGEAEPGATGLELLLPLVLKWADEERLSLVDALARVTCRSASVITGVVASVPTGRIEVGGAADLCLFDPDARWTVSPSALRSQGKNTPFIGYEMKGRVRATVVGGTVVHESR